MAKKEKYSIWGKEVAPINRMAGQGVSNNHANSELTKREKQLQNASAGYVQYQNSHPIIRKCSLCKLYYENNNKHTCCPELVKKYKKRNNYKKSNNNFNKKTIIAKKQNNNFGIFANKEEYENIKNITSN
ncbi:hypothetical protein AAEX28_07160 [Lentisphaerota bacterium WC36G]|nr:hypothetical protein LJT99_10025 [Lentisphaerae bacterium WC36]